MGHHPRQVRLTHFQSTAFQLGVARWRTLIQRVDPRLCVTLHAVVLDQSANLSRKCQLLATHRTPAHGRRRSNRSLKLRHTKLEPLEKCRPLGRHQARVLTPSGVIFFEQIRVGARRNRGVHGQ